MCSYYCHHILYSFIQLPKPIKHFIVAWLHLFFYNACNVVEKQRGTQDGAHLQPLPSIASYVRVFIKIVQEFSKHVVQSSEATRNAAASVCGYYHINVMDIEGGNMESKMGVGDNKYNLHIIFNTFERNRGGA